MATTPLPPGFAKAHQPARGYAPRCPFYQLRCTTTSHLISIRRTRCHSTRRIKSLVSKDETVKLPIFHGRATWVAKSKAHTNFNNWTDERKCAAFPLSLADFAWDFFTILPLNIQSSFTQLDDSFSQKFATKDLCSVHEQSLYTRQQGLQKTVDCI